MALIKTPQTPLVLGLAFLAILGGMTALGLLGLATGRRVTGLTRQSMQASTQALAEKIVRKVEKRIIDQDRVLLDLVDLKHLDDFKFFWDRLTTMSGLVEGAIVMDSQQRILHYASKEAPREQEIFTGLFLSRILPRMEVANLTPGLHKHLHMTLDGREYLISYLLRVQEGQRFLVALKVNMAFMLRRMLSEELETLQDQYVAGVSDNRGLLIIGQRSPPSLRQDRVRLSFPTTLYRWTLELAPRAGASLAAQAERRDRINLLLVLASMAVSVLGFGMLLAVVRRERALSALRSDFVTTVTHELKTPLSLIRMYSEMMTLDRPGAEAKRGEYARILARETDKLGRLIDNVLDLSRLEQGRSLLELRETDLVEVVKETLDEQRERPARSACALSSNLPSEPALIQADPDAIRLAILNLLDNAAKYGAANVWVSMSLEPRAVEVMVADDGPGIPAEEQARLFERFFRGKRAMRSRERGSGIGLSLVQLVAEVHRGRVSVADRPGGGAIFSLHLPRLARRSGPHPEKSEGVTATASSAATTAAAAAAAAGSDDPSAPTRESPEPTRER
ncbi:MAG: HAMP domain-containing sensor histidine kinase, partial [Polyangia bacterium]|nr:HAMP domain-containing sensor histidine kinase [Polyangia bacterium]